MTEAKTQHSILHSLAVPAALFLVLAAFSLAPLGCGTEPDETSEAGTDQTTEANTDRTILLNIGIEDETENRPLTDNFLVAPPGGENWAPGALNGGGTTRAFKEHPVGETRTLRIYPEGEDKRTLEVPITMKPDMSSALASSRTNVMVYDDSIVVTGPAVPDERMAFDRPPAPSNAP
ncbi:hypothetical protein [Salinibacter grassmerensis]|uniref:hypothetical protein n=1 Tax=Salinibacter grassmerensis TaxID=3040353 RepID=UPI0021E77315|nr:hypothetical protein [Salinibacter grassmerensis]